MPPSEDPQTETPPEPTERHKGAITSHLSRAILRNRGYNNELARDIELLPLPSQKRLFHILDDMEKEVASTKRRARTQPWRQ